MSILILYISESKGNENLQLLIYFFISFFLHGRVKKTQKSEVIKQKQQYEEN